MPDTPSFGFRPLTPVVKATLVLLGGMFVLLAILVRFSAFGAALRDSLILVPSLVLERPWTVVTYALVHDLSDPWHILFNAMVLYFFGSDLEERWGKGRFIAFMLSAVVGGAAVVWIVAKIGLGDSAVLGASAICEGAAVAWGLLNRDKEVFLYFFRVKGITLVYITLGFVVLQALTNAGVSAAAHFGGVLVGFAWAGAYVGPLRRFFLQRRLKRLEAERDAVVSAARRRSAAASSGLRVIPGGREDEGPKRYLN